MGIHLRLGGDEWGLFLRGIHFSLRHRTARRLLRDPNGHIKVVVVTACAVCISDVPFQLERENFDPHSSRIFLPIFLKLRNMSGIQTLMQNLVKIGSPGASGRTPKFWPYILGYLFLFLYSSVSVPVADEVSKRVSGQGRAFVGHNNAQ